MLPGTPPQIQSPRNHWPQFRSEDFALCTFVRQCWSIPSSFRALWLTDGPSNLVVYQSYQQTNSKKICRLESSAHEHIQLINSGRKIRSKFLKLKSRTSEQYYPSRTHSAGDLNHIDLDGLELVIPRDIVFYHVLAAPLATLLIIIFSCRSLSHHQFHQPSIHICLPLRYGAGDC